VVRGFGGRALLLVYELYVAPDRTLKVWSPAGGLQSAPINESAGVVVPNDGVGHLRVEVSARANSSLIVRVGGSDRITIGGLAGATSGKQRYLRVGIDHYDTAAAEERVTVYHSAVGYSGDDWLGAADGSTPPYGDFFDGSYGDGAFCPVCDLTLSSDGVLTARI
jgi:hypothetical protein